MLHQFYPQVPHDYRYELNKDMHLAAAHFIPSEAAGKCQDIHGHTYVINITVAGDQLDSSGFLIDFKILKSLIHRPFDHTLLNDHELFSDKEDNWSYPTTEVIAGQFWKLIQTELNQLPNQPKCIQLLVRETPTSYVVFRPKKEDFAI